MFFFSFNFFICSFSSFCKKRITPLWSSVARILSVFFCLCRSLRLDFFAVRRSCHTFYFTTFSAPCTNVHSIFVIGVAGSLRQFDFYWLNYDQGILMRKIAGIIQLRLPIAMIIIVLEAMIVSRLLFPIGAALD